MRLKRCVFILFLLLGTFLGSGTLFADLESTPAHSLKEPVLTLTPGGVSLHEANLKYKQGFHNEAILLYKDFLHENGGSSEIFYNLGNCYFKKKQIGMAKLYYLKAKRLSPRDPDVLHNLEFVQSREMFQVEDKRSLVLGFVEKVVKKLNKEEWRLVFFVSLSLFLLSCLILFYLQHFITRSLFVILIVNLFVAGGLWLVYSQWNNWIGREAVVLESKAPVRFGPFLNEKVIFELPSPAVITVIDKRSEWSKVKLVDGRQGWILNQAFQVV